MMLLYKIQLENKCSSETVKEHFKKEFEGNLCATIQVSHLIQEEVMLEP